MPPSDAGRRPLVIVLVAMLLAVAAWSVLQIQREAPLRTELTTQVNLMRSLRQAEYVQPTRRVNLGSPRGRRHTLGAERRRLGEAVGFLARDGEEQDFAWCIGKTPTFFLDVLEPADRVLSLTLAPGTDGPQSVEVSINGHVLGDEPLRRDGDLQARPEMLLLGGDPHRAVVRVTGPHSQTTNGLEG